MFTGIIEEIGRIRSVSGSPSGYRLVIEADLILGGLKPGDSVSVNGICLTADKIDGKTFAADIMPETHRHSSLGNRGARVNLERAMQLGGRLGGHIVSGHIDGTGTIAKRVNDGNSIRIRVETKSDLLRYIVKKGSIAIDGISLTVTDVDLTGFGVSIIPHTGNSSTLLEKRAGDMVNLETDILAKYIERLLNRGDTATGDGITMDFLEKHWF